MRRLLLSLLGLLFLGCGDTVNLISATVIKVESPTPNGTVFSLDPLVFRVTATNQAGVASLELSAGSVLLKTCSADSGASLTCEVTTALSDIGAQIKAGKLHLSATATDRKNKKVKKTQAFDVFVKPIRIAFTAPMADGDPPVAIVKGTSALSFEVQSDTAVDSVDVKDADGLQLVHFNGGDPYETMVNWPVKLGLGDHVITATATDAQPNSDSVSLTVRVLCAQDADCELHQTCVVATGVCQ